MQVWRRRFGYFGVIALLSVGCSAGCDDDDGPATGNSPGGSETAAPRPGEGTPSPTPPVADRAPAAVALPADLPNGLLLAYAQFVVEDGRVTATPGPARLELLSRRGGEWRTVVLEDQQSNVFHKAMVIDLPGAAPGLITLGGMAAAVKLWRPNAAGQLQAETLWTEEFGGAFNRMRDAEIADLYGDGRPAIAVATHDQGVVAVVRMPAEGGPQIERLDRRENTFVHEIEIGDLNGDGTLEVYATPSEPNRLQGGAQRGEVVRYVPKDGQGRTVVADLGSRHAKEIYVGDVDGDGRDELYVAVEAHTVEGEQGVQIVEPVEIRRYDHDTAPTAGMVIATINDRFTRFLTVGDVDGDGKKEMVAAAFRSGLWLLRPGTNPRGEWSVESIDRDSSGFEHAAVFADLDGDHRDELYVAADEQGELRRYVWAAGRARRETIHRRELPRAMMTWNIMPFPLTVLGPGGGTAAVTDAPSD